MIAMEPFVEFLADPSRFHDLAVRLAEFILFAYMVGEVCINLIVVS